MIDNHHNLNIMRVSTWLASIDMIEIAQTEWSYLVELEMSTWSCWLRTLPKASFFFKHDIPHLANGWSSIHVLLSSHHAHFSLDDAHDWQLVLPLHAADTPVTTMSIMMAANTMSVAAERNGGHISWFLWWEDEPTIRWTFARAANTATPTKQWANGWDVRC